MLIQVGIPCKWTNDSKNLLLEHFDIIHNSPSQLYHSVLHLCPSSSWLHSFYSVEPLLKIKVIKGLPVEWGACYRTVSLGSNALDLSYWNNTIAVSGEKDIIILNAITGSQTATLSGHTGWVMSVAFSPDGRSLVSGSNDRTVKLWDIQTGGVIGTFHGHTASIYHVSISADCARIASGSRDLTVCLWDTQTGECYCTTKLQDAVFYVSFSPINPQHITVISGSKVWQWDVNGHQVLPICNGSYIAFSPDHTQFVLCNGKVVTVQVSNSGAIVAEFHVTDDVYHCCFSPDGKLIAAAAGRTAYVWDITSPDPHLIETFVSNAASVSSLTFSSPSSLILAEHQLVTFWKIGGMPTGPVITNPRSTLFTSPSIKSVSLQARAGIAISSDADGVVKIWDILTGLCKESFQIPAASDVNLGQSSARVVDGRLIFVWYESGGVHIWDAQKGELLQTLDSSWCMDLRISGDGSKVFGLVGGFIQVWSMWTWEPVDKVKLGLEGILYLDSLCTDNSKVWVHSQDSPAQEGWDFGISGSSPVPFDPSTGRPYLDFIGGASWQIRSPSWIKNTVTGKEVFQLSGRYAKPKAVQWDGQYLVAGYTSGEVLILDFHHVYPE